MYCLSLQKNHVKKYLIYYTVLLYLLSLLAGPKDYFLSEYGLRPEDIFGIIITISVFAYFIVNKRILLPTSSGLILFYFIYLLIITVINDLFSNSPANSLILFSKEITFVAVFIAIFQLEKWEIERVIYIAILVLSPNVIFGIFQVITQEPVGQYGIAPFGHFNSPASSGLIYFSGIIFSALLFKNHNHRLCTVLIILFYLLTVLSGSKIATLGATSFIITFIILNNAEFNFLEFKKVVIVLFSLLLVLILFISILDIEKWNSLKRYAGFLDPLGVIAKRGIWWKVEWIESYGRIIFGGGLSVGHYVTGKFTSGMAFDNQYLYMLCVVGILGTTIIIYMMYLIYRNIEHKFHRYIYLSILFAYSLMGIGSEIFQLSISGSLFWIVSAICIKRNND